MPPSSPLVVASDNALPAGLLWHATQAGDRFHARLGRSRLPALGLLAFAVVWNGFLYAWYTLLFRGDGPTGVFFWFPILHVLAGGVITYRAFCLLLNSGHLGFDGTVFRFHRGPLPELGGVTIPVDDLRGFEVRGTPRRDGNASTAGPWFLLAETKGGQKLRVALDLPGEPHARYVAAQLTEALERAQHKSFESYRD